MPKSYDISVGSGSASPGLFALFLFLINPAFAQSIGSANPLYPQVEQFINAQLADQQQPDDRTEVTLSPIDSRLQLSACAHPLLFENQRLLKPGKFSLKASCTAPKRWSLYLSGRIEIYRSVVVSTQAIPRGTALTPSFLTLEERPLSRLQQGHYTSVSAVSEHLARRAIPARQVIKPGLLTPPLLVHEGDEVVIRAQAAGLTVETSGIALEDGRRNQQIDVKNRRSERIIRARVTGRGQVSTR